MLSTLAPLSCMTDRYRYHASMYIYTYVVRLGIRPIHTWQVF
jgi:hypothetical protein